MKRSRGVRENHAKNQGKTTVFRIKIGGAYFMPQTHLKSCIEMYKKLENQKVLPPIFRFLHLKNCSRTCQNGRSAEAKFSKYGNTVKQAIPGTQKKSSENQFLIKY